MWLLGVVESLPISTQEALGGLDSCLLALEASLQSSLSDVHMLCCRCPALLYKTACNCNLCGLGLHSDARCNKVTMSWTETSPALTPCMCKPEL